MTTEQKDYIAFEPFKQPEVPDTGHTTRRWGRDDTILADFGVRTREGADNIARQNDLDLKVMESK